MAAVWFRAGWRGALGRRSGQDGEVPLGVVQGRVSGRVKRCTWARVRVGVGLELGLRTPQECPGRCA